MAAEQASFMRGGAGCHSGMLLEMRPMPAVDALITATPCSRKKGRWSRRAENGPKYNCLHVL